LTEKPLILENSRIVSNTASSDGGGVYVRYGVVTMTQNLIANNVANTVSGGGSGGGAWLYRTPAYVADNTLQDNFAGSVGGGLYVGLGGDLIVKRNEFLYNTANNYAGGLHAGLAAIGSAYGLVVGCDMPFLNHILFTHAGIQPQALERPLK